MIQTNSLFDKINFNGGNLSSDGGSILLSQFLEKINLKKLLDSISFVDLRHLPVYSNTNILFQQIIKCLLGYNDQSDQKILINDPLLSLKSLICSQATVSRFYDRVSLNTTNEFKKIITQLAYDFVNTNIDDPILDADSTMVTTCGNQEASAYIHHYQENGYHPLIINEYHSKLLLSSLLRTGSAYSSNGIIEELEQIFTQLNNTGNIRFRGDSAFYRRDLFKYLENNQVTYYIRVKNFKKNIRESVMDMVINQVDWNDFDYTEPYYGEYTIQINKTKKRRIVYKAFRLEKGGMLQLVPMVYCIITNDFEKSPKEAMDFYEARGNSENFTKELKDDFNGGNPSHKEFVKNEMDFLISSLAYNLYHVFQQTILEEKDQTIRMNTYRLKYQKIAVKVIQHARQVTLSFSSAYKNKTQFTQYRNKVLQI
jgi:hypothetical protein